MTGRQKEIADLEELYIGDRAELVAIYGRRRVGKTYLVEQVFKNRFDFRHAGLSPVENERNGMLKAQLTHFYNSLKSFGLDEGNCPNTWLDAFYMLQKLLEKKDDGGRQVVFIDEMPWLDTPRSGFITAFEGFWNNWGCHRDNLMVIVCGSANSWMLDHLINSHGGLYGRVTYEMKLSPFTLVECEEYLKRRRVKLSRYDIAQAYMIVGGIPFYLQYFQKGLSLAQNVDHLFFNEDAKLRFEYERLFSSAFKNPGFIRTMIEFLYKKNAGYTRKEIAEFPLILLERKASSRVFLEQEFLRHGVTLAPEIELSSRSLLVSLSRIGLGVAGVTLEFVRKDLEEGGIRLLKTDFDIPARSVDMCTLRDVSPTAAATAFMEMVRRNTVEPRHP